MKKIVILSIFLCSASMTFAQSGYTSLHYDVSIPLGNTTDFIGKASFRGVGFDFRRMLSPTIGVGMSFAWHTFYERKDYGTYVDGATSITGVQFRYLNVLPMHVNANYYLGEEGDAVRPFLGLGIGTIYGERKTTMGQYSYTTKTWQFSMQPEVGVLYQVQSDAYIFMAGKFTTPFKNTELDSQPFLSLNFGLAWMLQ